MIQPKRIRVPGRAVSLPQAAGSAAGKQRELHEKL